jgi:hypothetical protein
MCNELRLPQSLQPFAFVDGDGSPCPFCDIRYGHEKRPRWVIFGYLPLDWFALEHPER